MLAYQPFTPRLRPRKVEIPLKSGMVDYGANYHDERILRVKCTIDGYVPDNVFDDLKYTLSRKGRIIMWDQPDRYYYGRAYDAAEVIDYYAKAMRDFELRFVTYPYARALEPTVLSSAAAAIPVDYSPTRRVPTRITIRNTGDSPLTGIVITSREKTDIQGG